MSDEVKEILKTLKENYEAVLRQRDDITKNATETIEKYQQENQKLKEELFKLKNFNAPIDNFKKRIDKAIEYIKENMKLDENSLIYVYEFDERKKLLEILKGDDK